MEHFDEKILDFINKQEKAEAKANICAGPVKIGKRYYEFVETSFFDDKLKIFIPKDFEDMPQKLRELKYPSIQRPEIIKTDDSGSVNITLNIIDSELDEESVKEVTDGMKAIIKRMNPATIFYSDGLEEVESKNIGYFEFKSPALDADIYNLMFFLEFKGKTLMGAFGCLYKECEEWRDIAFQVLRTVRVIK